MSFQLDRKGGAEVLKALAAEQIHALAQTIAEQAGPDAVVHQHTSDRAVSSVSVPADQQATAGALTRAASAAGLDVVLKKKQ